MTTDELNIIISADTGSAASNINNTAKALDDLGDSAKTADTDMSTLVKAMSDAAANMVKTAGNIAASASGLTDFKGELDKVFSSLQGVDFKFGILNGSIRDSYSAFDDAAKKVSDLADSSEKSAGALSGIVSATDGFASRMGELQGNTQNTSDSMASLQRELQETLTSVRGFSDNMSNAGKDAEESSRKIRELSDEVQKLVQKSSSGQNAVLGLAAGFKSLKGIVATLGIGKFIKDSNDAYNVQMQNELKLTAHMKQRMNATDDEIQAVKDLASAQQQLGVIGDEIQLAGAQQLTTYARQSSTLKTLLPAMNNLIAQNAGYEASVGDATSAADMLGRALNGQYTSLKRMGVTFTEAQEQILKYGTESQKAEVLVDAINGKVGNMNELLAQTPTGKLKQLQNDFGDLQEQLGATFQPLISAVIPVARNMLEILAPPILNISRGITVIGQAIASIDSPAVRGIALAAAGVAVVNKLRLALGGGGAALLVIGAILTGLLGSMQEEQESIGDIVSEAYNSATNAAGSATDAISDYNDEIANTQKSINRLAGFDTITKLSGGSSSGALVNALLGDNGLSDIYAATNAADDFLDITSSFEVPKLDFSKMLEELKNMDWVDLASGLTTGFNTALDLVDSAFGTHLGDWARKTEEFFYGYGQYLYELDQKMGAYLFGDENNLNAGLTKDVGDFIKSVAPKQSDLYKQGVLMADYGARTEEQLLRNDLSKYNQYMNEAYGVPLQETPTVEEFVEKNALPTASDFGVDISKQVEDKIAEFSESIGFDGGKSLYEIDSRYKQVFDYNYDLQTKQTDYRDIPTKSTNNFAAGGLPQINIGVTLDGEQISAHVVADTDTRANVENGKG